ncbi:MAG: FGGY-family carbohydrate kinase [Geminicoccaceae bacterium]
MSDLVMAIDVGTASARAGVFDRRGCLLGRAEFPIRMNRPEANFAEHDSEDIWRSVCSAANGAREIAEARPEMIKGISFDATCSLVARDTLGGQLSVSKTGDTSWDTIAWLDHRALAEADECTATEHAVLRYVGGVMSPEMQIPKLMWLKRRFPERWASAGYFFDLADFLTWKASGSERRSQCTLTCKWTYLGHETPGWQMGFLAKVGLEDLLERGRLPAVATPIGDDLGPLTDLAASDLDLTTDCRVGTGLIDAHAGVLGLLGGYFAEAGCVDQGGFAIERHMALIAGTSSSVMALSAEPRPTIGAWGPFFAAVLPDLWLIDAGQSATGALLDHLIHWHGRGGEPTADMHDRITTRIMALRAAEGADFAATIHVLPDFHGNRSPLADPHAVGVISGLDLDSSFDNLCRLYWRTAVGIALGVRHILDTLNRSGYPMHTLHVTGGHTKNPVLMELYGEAVGYELIERDQDHGVLLGTGAVAATAAGLHADLRCAAAAMASHGHHRPTDRRNADPYARDYRAFLAMHEHRKELDAIL